MDKDEIDRSLACDLVGDMDVTALRVPSFRNHRAASLPPTLRPSYRLKLADWKGLCVTVDVRFGSQADICAATTHVCFTPNNARKSGHAQIVMSALPPKADMCGAANDVCFGPKADILAAADDWN
jgi:hypothetical protein